MNYSIRPYHASEFEMLKSWWTLAKEVCPEKECLPEESTLILELDGVPALAITVYLTNCKRVAYLENFIGNPEMKGDSRKQASQLIVDAACNFAKNLGYTRILCLSLKDKLNERYVELGMKPTQGPLNGFIREL